VQPASGTSSESLADDSGQIPRQQLIDMVDAVVCDVGELGRVGKAQHAHVGLRAAGVGKRKMFAHPTSLKSHSLN